MWDPRGGLLLGVDVTEQQISIGADWCSPPKTQGVEFSKGNKVSVNEQMLWDEHFRGCRSYLKEDSDRRRARWHADVSQRWDGPTVNRFV